MKVIREDRLRRVGVAIAAAALFAGCGGGVKGPELAPVAGTVTLDGRPLPHARVVFQPSGPEASPSIGQTDDNGVFELAFNRKNKGALLGPHVVRVTTGRIVSDPSGKETVVEEKVPPQYNDRTELKYDVKPQANRFEILLESSKVSKK